MNLSKNFTLEELTFSQTAARRGIDNTPNEDVFRNLKRLCALLEDVRDVCAAPIIISSGYRSPALNVAVGGAKKSQHTMGLAADFTAKGLTVDETVQIIIEAGLPYDQVIKEFNSWVHISIPQSPTTPPRLQALTIDKEGTRIFA
jgi:hypothetical protein